MEFNGATIWLRKTIESDIFYWKPDKWFKIWFFIVNKVNHKDTRLFERGSNFTTYEEISKATRASRDQVDKFIRWARKEQMLATEKTTHGIIIKVLRYAEYQDYIKSKSDTESEIEARQKRDRSDTINNNGNNDNKINTIKLGCQIGNHLAPQVRLGKDRLINGAKAPNVSPMYKETIIELDEYGEPIKQAAVPKKYKHKGRFYTRIITWYMKIRGEEGNANRYLPVMKDITEQAEKNFPNKTEAKLEEEIKMRILCYKDYQESKELSWGLNGVHNHWNEIVKLAKEINFNPSKYDNF